VFMPGGATCLAAWKSRMNPAQAEPGHDHVSDWAMA